MREVVRRAVNAVERAEWFTEERAEEIRRQQPGYQPDWRLAPHAVPYASGLVLVAPDMLRVIA